jgi:hypothetical protein
LHDKEKKLMKPNQPNALLALCLSLMIGLSACAALAPKAEAEDVPASGISLPMQVVSATVMPQAMADANSTPVQIAESASGGSAVISEPFNGWSGSIYSFPAGSQYKYYFVRQDLPQVKFGIGATDDWTNQAIAAAADTQQVIYISGTLMTGVPAPSGGHLNVTAFEILENQKPDAVGGEIPINASEVIPGWTGQIYSYPPGNQFGRYFVREDAPRTEFGLSANAPAIREQINALRDSGKRIRIWGTLYILPPEASPGGGQIVVERIEVLD